MVSSYPPFPIGRFGSRIHSLQEPGYKSDPANPAASIASRLWQAVTPVDSDQNPRIYGASSEKGIDILSELGVKGTVE